MNTSSRCLHSQNIWLSQLAVLYNVCLRHWPVGSLQHQVAFFIFQVPMETNGRARIYEGGIYMLPKGQAVVDRRLAFMDM